MFSPALGSDLSLFTRFATGESPTLSTSITYECRGSRYWEVLAFRIKSSYGRVPWICLLRNDSLIRYDSLEFLQ
jgi:hypothetical protein